MVRKQIYLTEQENEVLKKLALVSGTNQSELIRQAIDQFIETRQRMDLSKLITQAKGLWQNRDDFLELRSLRSEWDRY